MTAQDHEDASDIVAAAGELLLSRRAWGSTAGWSSDELGRQADRTANEFILRQLIARHPDDPVLSEEAEDPRSRLVSRRVWIVDPLDGTWEFGEGRDDWGVNIALVVDGVPVVGAMALPASGRTLCTAHPWEVPRQTRRLLILVSRSRAPAFAVGVAERLRAELRALGSAAAKAAAVLTGEADIYLHADGMYEWDSAAPVALARACGLHASRLDGSSLRYNQPDPFLPDLLICLPELADDVIEAVRECSFP
ncbi:MAG: 3'(2'),5'-bisphosphate nucleotidase CysQ [Pseudonocardiaceae bacterium]